jgi:hypothetical protein
MEYFSELSIRGGGDVVNYRKLLNVMRLNRTGHNASAQEVVFLYTPVRKQRREGRKEGRREERKVKEGRKKERKKERKEGGREGRREGWKDGRQQGRKE